MKLFFLKNSHLGIKANNIGPHSKGMSFQFIIEITKKVNK